MLNDYTVIDFETTGLDSAKDKIIEIGALRVVNGEPVHQMQVLVNAAVELDPFITNLTGIKTEDLRNGISISSAIISLLDIIGPSTVVAHNASFDLAFLVKAMEWSKPYASFTNPFLCTKTVAAFTFPGNKNGLADLCKDFGIVQQVAHRAINDVKATYKLLHILAGYANLNDYLNILGHYHKYGPPAWIPDYATVKTY